MTQGEQTHQLLTCVECEAEAPPDAHGWRAYLTVEDVDEPEPVEGEVVVLFPTCAAREFGD